MHIVTMTAAATNKPLFTYRLPPVTTPKVKDSQLSDTEGEVMVDTFSKTGLFFDDLNKVRVLEPDVATQTEELRDECKDFVEKVTAFHKLADSFLILVKALSSEVENAKMKAIGTRNLLKNVSKQREAQQQQLQALILEKSTELERLHLQHQSLVRVEQEQQEFIQQLILNR